MRWVKKGLIFTVDRQSEWMSHHACVPVADRVSDDVLRIYFGPRDTRGRTRTTFIEVEADNPSKVLRVHDRPVFDLGRLGAFDDSGVMPSCIVNHGGRKYLLYIGWSPAVTVPYRNAIGLAESRDGGLTFERVFEGPIVDRTRHEPFFTASPFALIDEGVWKLWYASSTGFVVADGKPEPVYRIQYAESKDGAEWTRSGEACIPYVREGEANARPCVLKDRGRYRMWYCWRGSRGYRTNRDESYRLGYAESADGIRWTRLDDRVGIDRSESGWDSQMMEYPFVYEHKGKKHMLYNGNGFGESGFGWAVLEEDR
ncbi:MAG TPA: hypothetical protein VFQ07_00415 [Candidatus Polarisedimenticolia bacterium]|nr:hypothetical protein [Candidatus Polarisedimenticolia bacterium]